MLPFNLASLPISMSSTSDNISEWEDVDSSDESSSEGSVQVAERPELRYNWRKSAYVTWLEFYHNSGSYRESNSDSEEAENFSMCALKTTPLRHDRTLIELYARAVLGCLHDSAMYT